MSDDGEIEQRSESSSGRSTGHNDSQLHRISDVKTLEYLTRIYIMLAQIVGKKSAHFTDYCLFAVTCIERMWKVCVKIFLRIGAICAAVYKGAGD